MVRRSLCWFWLVPGVGCTSFKGAKGAAKVPLPAAWAIRTRGRGEDASPPARQDEGRAISDHLQSRTDSNEWGLFVFLGYCLQKVLSEPSRSAREMTSALILQIRENDGCVLKQTLQLLVRGT